MTGPQGMGPLMPNIMVPADIGGIGGGGISPIEYVWSFSGGVKGHVDLPAAMLWLPGDYMISAWWDTGGPTLTGLPTWMNPIEGLGLVNPNIWGGFIPDFYAIDAYVPTNSAVNWAYSFTTNITDQTTCKMVHAVYRNVSRDAAVAAFIRDRLNSSPLDDTVDAVTVPVDGSSVLLGITTIGTGAASSFLFPSPAVERLSTEPASAFSARVFDRLNGAGVISYQTVDTTNFPSAGNDNNYFWNLALNAGPAGYNPPYDPIGFMGATIGSTLSGNTHTVTLPSNSPGDLIVIAMHLDSNQSSPFAELASWKSVSIINGGRTIKVYMKRAGASETNPTFTAVDSGTRKQHACAVYSGVGAVNWIQGAAGNTLTPSVVTTVDGTRAIAIATSEFYQPITLGTSNGYTQRANQGDTNDGGVSLSDKVFAGVSTTVDFPIHAATGSSSFMEVGLITMIPGDPVIPITVPVTINQAATQGDPTIGNEALFDIEFDEPVGTFVNGDVTISGTAPGTIVKTLTPILGTGRHFRLLAKGASGDGTIIASIGSAVATSVNTGSFNAGSSSTDDTVTIDISSMLLPGARGYFDAADLALATGADVQNALLKNRVGGGYDPTTYQMQQGYAGSTLSTINGRPAISIAFSSSNSRIGMSGGNVMSGVTQPQWLMMAVHPAGDCILYDCADTGTNRAHCYKIGANWTMYGSIAANCGAGSNTAQIVFFLWDGASSKFFKDGALVTTVNVGTPTQGGSGTLAVGNVGAGGVPTTAGTKFGMWMFGTGVPSDAAVIACMNTWKTVWGI